MRQAFCLLIALFIFVPVQISAQFIVTIQIQEPTIDSVYLAGNINGWNPGDLQYRVNNGILTLEHIGGVLEFKFTKGSWTDVETNTDGSDLPNRVIKINSDTTIICTIQGWKKNEADIQPIHTASPQVQVLKDSFYMPQLNRYKAIWVYLPKSYTISPQKRYPVLYMQDGQNLFDKVRSAHGEWQIDEMVDSITANGLYESIIVGIDNDAEKRINEYNPYSNERFGTGEGDAYLSFIVHTLKPFVDSTFRTLADDAHTAIGGSSMGALISFYALIKYPNTFGCAGIFSPSFWIAPQIKNEAAQTKLPANALFYFYAGEMESDEMLPDMLSVLKLIDDKNCCKTFLLTNALGQHKESYWRAPFADFYSWWMQQISLR